MPDSRGGERAETVGVPATHTGTHPTATTDVGPVTAP
jgi:hypothetical protein